MKDQSGVEKDQAITLVRQFEQLQEERVHSYTLLQEGHKVYLSTGPDYDFPTFRSLVHEVTQDFKRISQGIMALEETLRTEGHTAIADIIASIQNCEKKKLELTTHLQLAKQMVQEPGSGEMEADIVKKLRSDHGKVVEEINDQLTELRYEIQPAE